MLNMFHCLIRHRKMQLQDDNLDTRNKLFVLNGSWLRTSSMKLKPSTETKWSHIGWVVWIRIFIQFITHQVYPMLYQVSHCFLNITIYTITTCQYLLYTVKLFNNGHPFCRGLVAIVDECPLLRDCGKMSTNPSVWRGQGRLIYTKSVLQSFRPTKKCTDLQYRAYQWHISSCLSSRLPWSFISLLNLCYQYILQNISAPSAPCIDSSQTSL